MRVAGKPEVDLEARVEAADLGDGVGLVDEEDPGGGSAAPRQRPRRVHPVPRHPAPAPLPSAPVTRQNVQDWAFSADTSSTPAKQREAGPR